MIFLAILLVAAITLPQGFAKHTKNFGNRSQPLARHTIVQSAPNSTIPKTPSQQSGSELLMQGSGPPNYLLELIDGSGNVAFATPLVKM